MINKILDAISQKLNAEFEDNYELYSENIKQDFKEPCFFIMCLNPSEQNFLANRYYRKYLFDIQYFPKSKKNLNSELYDIQERLFNCMEYVNIGNDLIRGKNRRGEIEDNTLHFFVNYDVFVVKKGTEEDYMGNLKTNIKTK